MAFRHLTKITDLSPEELATVVDHSVNISEGRYIPQRIEMTNPTRGLATALFEKDSLRTQQAWVGAAHFIGLVPSILKTDGILTKSTSEPTGTPALREQPQDVAGYLGEMTRFLGLRVNDFETIATAVQNVTRTHVINLLCNKHHPMQAIADSAMIRKLFPEVQSKDMKVVYAGEWNNVSNSLAQACVMQGMEFVHTGPDGHDEGEEDWKEIQRLMNQREAGKAGYERDFSKALQGSRVVYGDTFDSMGNNKKTPAELARFMAYQVTEQRMAEAHADAVYLHCGPFYRDVEVTNGVIEQFRQKIYALGAMRTHAQLSVFDFLRDTEKA